MIILSIILGVLVATSAVATIIAVRYLRKELDQWGEDE